MAHTVKLGTFSKLENSTAQPTMTGWAEFNCTFKDGSDLDNPVLNLSGSLTTFITYNYAYMLGRYYFVRNRVSERNNLVTLTLELDAMATYKTEIGASSLYVLRAASTYNGTIQDNFYPPVGAATYSTDYDPNNVPLDYTNGYYLVNCHGITTHTDSLGITHDASLIQLSPDNYLKLIKNLYTGINGFSISDMIETVVQYFGGNPAGLISSVVWFPDPFITPNNNDLVYIGSWLSGVMGDVVRNPLLIPTAETFTISKHPKAATRGSYLNLAPYMQYTLYLPGAGAVQLDTTQLVGVNSITVNKLIDGYSGQIKYMVMAGSHVIANLTGQWGVPIRVGGNNAGQSVVGGATSALGAGLLAAATGGASAIIGASMAGIGTVTSAMNGVSFNQTIAGGIVNIYQQPVRLDTTSFDIPDEDNTHMGRPLCQVKQISTLSGYIKVSEGCVALPAPLPICQKVKRTLEAGFFYE